MPTAVFGAAVQRGVLGPGAQGVFGGQRIGLGLEDGVVVLLLKAVGACHGVSRSGGLLGAAGVCAGASLTAGASGVGSDLVSVTAASALASPEAGASLSALAGSSAFESACTAGFFVLFLLGFWVAVLSLSHWMAAGSTVRPTGWLASRAVVPTPAHGDGKRHDDSRHGLAYAAPCAFLCRV